MCGTWMTGLGTRALRSRRGKARILKEEGEEKRGDDEEEGA